MTACMLAGLGGCKPGERTYIIVSQSMEPLLRPGDRIVVDESAEARSQLHDGDLIALKHGEIVVIKRIIAMPGETVGNERKIFRNGKQLDEPYLAPPISNWGPPVSFLEQTVPAGELFVLGDNRDRSLDSRSPEYGPVRLSDVTGKYVWTYWHGPSRTQDQK